MKKIVKKKTNSGRSTDTINYSRSDPIEIKQSIVEPFDEKLNKTQVNLISTNKFSPNNENPNLVSGSSQCVPPPLSHINLAQKEADLKDPYSAPCTLHPAYNSISNIEPGKGNKPENDINPSEKSEPAAINLEYKKSLSRGYSKGRKIVVMQKRSKNNHQIEDTLKTPNQIISTPPPILLNGYHAEPNNLIKNPDDYKRDSEKSIWDLRFSFDWTKNTSDAKQINNESLISTPILDDYQTPPSQVTGFDWSSSTLENTCANAAKMMKPPPINLWATMNKPPPINPYVAPKPKDIFESLLDEICIICKSKNPNFVSKCEHFYHINCLMEIASQDTKCIKCQNSINLEGIEIISADSCQVCSRRHTLWACKNCMKNYCYFCIARGITTECCKDISKNMKDLTTKCVGCRMNRFFSDFVPISCPDHSLLCKKCWNLGIELGRCLLGCNILFKLSEYVQCCCCHKNGTRYYGEWVCHNDCQVCEFCQVKSIINAGDNIRCPACFWQLADKTIPWV